MNSNDKPLSSYYLDWLTGFCLSTMDIPQIKKSTAHPSGLEDQEQLVVPKAELRRAPCGLLARPGTKVFFPHEGHGDIMTS